jgi:hypothetical protein
MIKVAKEMLEVHHENGEFMDLTKRQMAYKWMPAVGGALKWKFVREENVDAESGDEEDSDKETVVVEDLDEEVEYY